MELTDIYKIFYAKAEEYTFLSSAHGTFNKIDHIIGCEAVLKNKKKNKIIFSVLWDHNDIKLELNLWKYRDYINMYFERYTFE